MVVLEGCFHGFVIPYINHVDLSDHPNMAGKAVLICRPSSHPFVDRTLTLDHPVKIGRSVARARATSTNGIFDCKVLSRNHAMLWYSSGKFYLQDTKSSNGTFVNNQRLSKSGEDSTPREVSSGDIVQFGVDVLENARKVTHGCIVAHLKLYLPDGKEAKASLSTSVYCGNVASVTVDDLYQLNNYIQEALMREQMLQTKMTSLQQIVMTLKQAADLGWQALIAEDRLLSRVEILEDQLQAYAKNFAEDKLREELQKLQEEKSVYQGLSKECLQKVLQEKIEAVQKCQDIKRALLNAEQECVNYKEMMERNNAEMQELANKHSTQVLQNAELQNQFHDSEEDYKDALARTKLENEVLNSEMNRMLENEAVMKSKIKELEESTKNLAFLQCKNSSDIHNHITLPKEQNGVTEGVICKNIDEEELKRDNKNVTDNSLDSLIIRLNSLLDMQNNFKELIVLTQAQITLLENEKVSKNQQLKSAKAELKENVGKLYEYKKENTMLNRSLCQLESSQERNKLKSTLMDQSSVNDNDELENSLQPDNTESLQAQIEELKEQIKISQSNIDTTIQTVSTLEEDLEKTKRSRYVTIVNCTQQEEKLKKVIAIKEHSDTTVNELCELVKCLENTIMQSKLQEKFELESEHTIKHDNTAPILNLLLESEQDANQNKNEAGLVKDNLNVVSEELEMASTEIDNTISESEQDNKIAEELIAARLESAALEAKVVALETVIKKLRLESNQRQQELEERDEMVASSPGCKDDLIEKLQIRRNQMEEELVIFKEKYMACNEKNTQLEKKLSSLQQDYEAVLHQPYFNVVFALPLLILFIAMTIAFHPTLASLMGTLDSWRDL